MKRSFVYQAKWKSTSTGSHFGCLFLEHCVSKLTQVAVGLCDYIFGVTAIDKINSFYFRKSDSTEKKESFSPPMMDRVSQILDPFIDRRRRSIWHRLECGAGEA